MKTAVACGIMFSGRQSVYAISVNVMCQEHFKDATDSNLWWQKIKLQ